MSLKIIVVGVVIATVLSVASGLIVSISPPAVTVFPNAKVEILCTSNAPLTYCRFTIPGIPNAINLSPKTQYNREYNYFGTGLENMHCGVTLTSAAEKHNGNITCEVGKETDSSVSSATMQLTVARSPDTPVLVFAPDKPAYRVNDMITASCTISNGRPAASIRWSLGDALLNSDTPVQDIVSHNDLHTAVDVISRTLTSDDNDKILRCEGDHVAYGTKNRRAEKQIVVQYAPRMIGKENQTDFKPGQKGSVAVKVQANPEPMFLWFVRGEEIQKDDQKYKASVTKLSKYEWKASLSVLNVSVDDLGNHYNLTASNDEGRISYPVEVKSYATPTPTGSTDNDTLGRDIGIGIGVTLIIVILMALGCYRYRDKVSETWQNVAGKQKYSPPAPDVPTNASDAVVYYDDTNAYDEVDIKASVQKYKNHHK